MKDENYPMIADSKVTYGKPKENSFDEIKEAIQEVDDSSFRMLEFRNTGQSEGELKKKIQKHLMNYQKKYFIPWQNQQDNVKDWQES